MKDTDDENEEVIRLTKIEDKDLGIDKEIEEPVIFGGAILSDDEKALLINRPEYATFGKLIRSDIQVEIEMGLAKIRWDRKKRGYKEESDSDSGIETGDEGNNDDLAKEAESRATYSRENKRLDMGNRRATDCKNNRRTYLSKARPLLEEAELLLRREAWDMVVKKYIEKHCNLKGNQNVNNLNESEQRGLRSLLKRVMDKEIVINSSDKGKRLVVSTLKSYEEQGKVHTSKDKETNLKEVLLMQRKLTSHSRALCNAFGAGKNHGDRNSQRVWDNVSSRSGTVPLLHLMPKLHKKYYENGNPQTRPVVGASSGMTTRASEVLCDVIDAVGKSHPDQQECPSTEACCNKMEDSEVIIEERGVNVIVGSIDAVGLYPNLNIPLAAREVSKEWMESGMEVDNFDYRAAGVYLASTCTKEAIIEVGLGGVIPERIHKKGPTPQVNTKENISRLKEKAARYVEIGHDEFEQENNTKEDKKVETKWGPMPEVMSPETKRKIVGLVIETAIINIMKMHCYRFEGKYFIQGGGGAIGLRLTGLVAKIVMARWARKLKYLIEKVVWCIYLFVIYVDDCNVYMEALEKGVYWDKENKNLGWSAEQEVTDASSGKSDARRTMDIFLQMANSIFTYVTFTSDLPEDHENGKCPMLDLMTWKERVEDKERPRGYKEVVKHSFYEKPVASKLVIMCKSAMPEKIKIVTNSQEIVRILRNCGNNITAGEKAEHLTSMMRKLRRSGYGVNMRKNILNSGTTGYYNMRKVEAKGGRRVNRPATEGIKERDIQRIVGKTAWMNKVHNDTNTSNSRFSFCKPGARKNGKRMGGKKNKDENEIEGIIFIPCTPRGELVKELQKIEDIFAKRHGLKRVKFVERGGDTLTEQLTKKNPWGGVDCERKKCWLCHGGEEKQLGKCIEEGVLYRISCLGCLQRGIETSYIGETSRDLYSRIQEHMMGLENMKKENAFWEHCMIYHNAAMQTFKIEMIGKAFSAFVRQIKEAVMIINNPANLSLNRKNEWNGSNIPRLVIQVKDKIISKDHQPGKGSRKSKQDEVKQVKRCKVDIMIMNIEETKRGRPRKSNPTPPAPRIKILPQSTLPMGEVEKSGFLGEREWGGSMRMMKEETSMMKRKRKRIRGVCGKKLWKPPYPQI